MPAKQMKPNKEKLKRKGIEQDPAGQILNPDEVITEINQQSTALKKIVSRFLDPVNPDNLTCTDKD